MAKLINSKYLKSGDVLHLKDGRKFGVTTKVKNNFHNDDELIYRVVRKISTRSPHFLGFTNENPKRIAIYIKDDKKFATANYYPSKKHPGFYNVVLWEDTTFKK